MSKTKKKKDSKKFLSLNRKNKQKKQTKKGLARQRRQEERSKLGYCEPPPMVKEKNIKLSEEENQFAWDLSKELGKRRQLEVNKVKHLFHQKVHCKICEQSYCLAGDGTDVFCRTCWINSKKKEIEDSGGIFTGCQKELTGYRTCQHCGG